MALASRLPESLSSPRSSTRRPVASTVRFQTARFQTATLFLSVPEAGNRQGVQRKQLMLDSQAVRDFHSCTLQLATSCRPSHLL